MDNLQVANITKENEMKNFVYQTDKKNSPSKTSIEKRKLRE